MNILNAYYSEMFCKARGGFFWQIAVDLIWHEQEFAQFKKTMNASIRAHEFKAIIFPNKHSPAELVVFLNYLEGALRRRFVKIPSKFVLVSNSGL